MIHLLPIRKIFSYFAAGHAALLILAATIFYSGTSLVGILRYSSIAVAILDLIVLAISTYLWRWLWKRFPILSELLFPDINGIWKGKIEFEGSVEPQSLTAKVRIRQNFWFIHVDLCSETSKSTTLLAYPITEAGNKVLYYIYQNIPKNPNHVEYKGTSVWQVDTSSSPCRLSGRYFTDRGTRGRISLTQVSFKPTEPYELY